MSRIDLLIQREVRRWQLAGQDPNDHLRGLYLSDVDAVALLSRPFGSSWGQTTQLEAEEGEAFAHATEQARQHAALFVREAERRGTPSRLAQLQKKFALTPFEFDTLLICLAPSLDLRYESLFGFLQDDITRKEPSVNLILNLLCDSPAERLLRLAAFSDGSPLIAHHLVERPANNDPSTLPLLKQTLAVDRSLLAWLLGGYRPHSDLGAHAELRRPEPSEGDMLLSLGVAPIIEHLAKMERPLVVFHGPDSTSQFSSAILLATQMKRPLLRVDLSGVIQEGTAPREAMQLALRDARLTGALPYLTGWDACLVNGIIPPDLLNMLCDYEDTAIVAGQAGWQPQGIDRDRPLFWLAFPTPTYPQRRELWRYFLSQRHLEEELDVQALAGQFRLNAGTIRDAVATANDWAAQQGRTIQTADLFQAARSHSSPNLSGLAHKIVPRFHWDDLILPPDQVSVLKEIISTVRGRPIVLEEWGVGKKLASSAGVTVLFAGPPGTGKTTAAEVIARELGLDLYKIDLSTMVSKYIGETEKNLGRLFDEAESSNAILFFDEADSIFGKRSEVKDAHDRYANIEVSYLLQRMESYDGITILATNLRANLDDAFTRRLQFAIDLPFPDEAERLRIWQSLFPTNIPSDKVDLEVMARRFKLAGGSIRNILVSAAYLAAADSGRITMEHLLHGTRRELQKMGRLIGDVDLSHGEPVGITTKINR